MQTIIEQKVNRRFSETVQIKAPAFYKVKHSGILAIYSEDKTISVFVSGNHVSVGVFTLSTAMAADPIFEAEVTEQEFNTLLLQAQTKIAFATTLK